MLVNQQQTNPHKYNTRTLNILLLLFLYAMFRSFIRPVFVFLYDTLIMDAKATETCR